MKNIHIKNMVLSAMFIAIGIILPFFTGQIKSIGNMLLPMHIPVMFAGLISGPWWGLAVGLMTPLLRSVMFGMPVMFPSAFAMSFELATYSVVVGLMYKKLHWHCVKALYKSLLVAMVSGRVVWGIVMACIMGIGSFTFEMFITQALINAIPGIILQLVIIPVIMVRLGKAKAIKWNRK